MRPGSVRADLAEPVESFWRRRLAQHTQDTYRGRILAKMPEDLRVYQHLIEESGPDVIVELGTYDGGSAIWFADQLTVMRGGGRVITVDIRQPSAPITDERVAYINLPLAEAYDAVASLIPAGARVMVAEDSAHVYQSTIDALRLFSGLVTKGCWFVVEDGVVDEPISIWAGGGVQPAIADFLATPDGARFAQHDLAIYGLTTDHNGWLEAIA